MERDIPHPYSDELLENLGWVRRLALAIVRDAGAADDITQDVARVALERRDPVSSGGLRAWLGAVTRKLALDRTRSEAARRAREHSVARPEGDGSEAEIVERSARQQRVARAVMELAEPYRSTILYRYLDEMPMAEVARRTDVNEVTARKRLSRGLEMLRTRLDTEFGTSTRNWAIGLIGPVKGTLLMSTKWIAATAAAAVVVGLAWVGLRSTPRETVTQPSQPVVAIPRPTTLSENSIDDPAGAPTGRAPLTALAQTKPSSLVATGFEVTLHVRVVDHELRPLTQGNIECIWWTHNEHLANASSKKRVFADIHSAVTDVRLPALADHAVLRVRPAGSLDQKQTVVAEVQQGATGPIERDVLVTLDEPAAKPVLHGTVSVDGRVGIPRALAIEVRQPNKGLGLAQIDERGAAYLIIDAGTGTELWITSDETVPVKLTVSSEAAEARSMDIELSGARTLRFTFLDKISGKPLANLAFIVSRGIQLPGFVTRSDSRGFHTDAQGQFDLHGVLTEMLVSIHPDLGAPPARTNPFTSSFDRGNQSTAPWWSERLGTDAPVREIELRVTPVFPGARVFGTLSADLLAGQSDPAKRVHINRREVTDAHDAPVLGVALDNSGAWSFQTHWPSRFEVWAEREKDMFVASRRVQIDVDGDGSHGPIDLPLATPEDLGSAFELRLVNIPEGAEVEVGVWEEKKSYRYERVPCREAPCIHRVRLGGPSKIGVTARLNQANFGSEVRRSLSVDPVRDTRTTIDLGGDQMHTIEFEAHGAAIPVGAMLGLVRLGAKGTDLSEATSTTLIDGRATAPVSLGPGRWFFECFDNTRDFNVTGVIDVGAGTSTVRIVRDVVSVERAGIPHGVEFTELDGIRLGELEKPIRYPSTNAEGKVVMNSTAKYTALP